MTVWELIHEGPALTEKDLAPFIKKKVTETIISAVPGMVGPILFHKFSERRWLNLNRSLIVKQDKRRRRVDFTRGEPYVIVTINGRHYVVTRKAYEKRLVPIVLVGSTANKAENGDKIESESM